MPVVSRSRHIIGLTFSCDLIQYLVLSPGLCSKVMISQAIMAIEPNGQPASSLNPEPVVVTSLFVVPYSAQFYAILTIPNADHAYKATAASSRYSGTGQ
ncbi:hypothetical protein QR685DRAFT_567679 [Neurospora intermedia]|uniref:Uncharacterized protein n=1 Tax=Neurospora intermedia TaxID=5142 RepID=A0ABR3DQ40_NEUIN